MTPRHAPWTHIKPGAMPGSADDIAEHYAREFAASADGEARWLVHAIGGGVTDLRTARAVLAKALVRAAIKLEDMG